MRITRKKSKMFKNHKMVNKDKTENTPKQIKEELKAITKNARVWYEEGFIDGKKQAFEEVEKIIDSITLIDIERTIAININKSDWTYYALGYLKAFKLIVKQKLEKMK